MSEKPIDAICVEGRTGALALLIYKRAGCFAITQAVQSHAMRGWLFAPAVTCLDEASPLFGITVFRTTEYGLDFKHYLPLAKKALGVLSRFSAAALIELKAERKWEDSDAMLSDLQTLAVKR